MHMYRQIHLHMKPGEILIIGENGYKICCILRIDIEFEMGENKVKMGKVKNLKWDI